jgi:hypothetical protein
MAPFFTISLTNWNIILTPQKMGSFFYVLFMLILLLMASWKAIRIFNGKKAKEVFVPYLIAFLCFFHGLSHLGFNVLLCGTHERYLYLGYPFLIIALFWFWTRRISYSFWAFYLCFISALFYGAFVYSKISSFHGVEARLVRPEFLSVIHAGLLLVLFAQWVHICCKPVLVGDVKRQKSLS